MAIDKAIDSAKLNSDLRSIADSVRAKGNTTALFKSAYEMKSAVDMIELAKPEQHIRKNIGKNGRYEVTPDEGKTISSVIFNVVVPPTPTQEKTAEIAVNGQFVVTPDSGYNLTKVTINTNCPEPKLEQEKTIEITQNGTETVTPDMGKALSKVIITTNISGGGGGIEPFTSFKIINWTPSKDEQLYTVPEADRDGLSFILMFCDSAKLPNNYIHSIYAITANGYASDAFGLAGGAWEGEYYDISAGLASYKTSDGSLGDDNGGMRFKAGRTYIVILGYGL